MQAPANADTHAMRAFHEATKHSAASVMRSRHTLDWANQPRPWKLYADDLPAVPLVEELPASGVAALTAIAGGAAPSADGAGEELTFARLSAVLLFSAGVTRALRVGDGTMLFRAAACTGALYHIELYVVCGDLPGLAAGVYHYGVHDSSLRRLRAGDWRGVLAATTGGEPHVSAAAAAIVYTSTFWRNAWKYQVRAYRHTFWDSGTIIANSLAVGGAHGLGPAVVTGFVDAGVNGLLGLDSEREVAVALLPLGAGARAPAAGRVVPLALRTLPASPRETPYPAMTAAHSASCLTSAAEVTAWRSAWQPVTARAARADAVRLPAAGAGREGDGPQPELAAIERVIVRRGSSRRFTQGALTLPQLSALLAAAAHAVPMDATGGDTRGLTEAYVIANAVEGLAPGRYAYDGPAHTLEPLGLGETRADAGHLALDQELAADAAVNLYLLADIGRVLGRLGNRGYRAAQLDGAIRAGRAYLAAYALGVGASGLTFYDDEVTEYFGPRAHGMGVMFLLAAGVPARRVAG